MEFLNRLWNRIKKAFLAGLRAAKEYAKKYE